MVTTIRPKSRMAHPHTTERFTGKAGIAAHSRSNRDYNEYSLPETEDGTGFLRCLKSNVPAASTIARLRHPRPIATLAGNNKFDAPPGKSRVQY
jgi:hypothetical protein